MKLQSPEFRAQIEAEVTQLFADLLGAREITSDADFFEFEGDSLAAVCVMAFLEKRYRVSLPVSVILEAPTPRLLAKRVAEANKQELTSCMIHVQEAQEGAPLFVVHGLAGDVAYARYIAETLGPSRPVYGLRAVGLRAGELPLPTICKMADHYVAEIRSIRPDGPYLVHGYCGGAFIAYEIAQQLQRGGATVSGLIVVDPPLDWRRSPFLVTSGRRLPLLMAAARVRLLWARARSFFRERNSDGYRRVLVARTLWNALANYIPEPYQGPALVLYCSEQRGILLNRKRGLHHLMPYARFVECGSTHGSLFERSSRVLAETKSFIERVEPANAGAHRHVLKQRRGHNKSS